MVTAARRVRLAVPATLLVLLGVLLLGLYRVSSVTEKHSYASGATAPASVHVTAGKSYALSVHGGINGLQHRGVSIVSPNCTWSLAGSAAAALPVAMEKADTKATNQVGTFVAPATGDVHVECAGWGVVFVDDADNASGDLAGVFLLGGVVALTLGVILALAAARQAVALSSARRSAGEQDEVEARVDVAGWSGGPHGEVRHDDLGDVTR